MRVTWVTIAVLTAAIGLCAFRIVELEQEMQDARLTVASEFRKRVVCENRGETCDAELVTCIGYQARVQGELRMIFKLLHEGL